MDKAVVSKSIIKFVTALPSLTTEEADRLYNQYGPNTIRERRPPSDVSLFLSQFKSPLIYVLLAAGLVTVLLQDLVDATIIFLAVFINTILGFVQERKAQHSLYALKKFLIQNVRVIRDGKPKIIDAKGLVPDDTVLLAAGDRIPADGILLESHETSANEAILTGESFPVSKYVDGDSTVFAGTTLLSGRATMRVTATGMHTRIGSIAETLEETPEEETTLQLSLRSLARTMTGILLGVSFFVFLIGINRGEKLVVMFTTAVALAVSSVPEGMAVTLTVILAIGMQRILKQRALVRRLISAETLGSVTCLAVDKTGTLTEGVMQVVKERVVDPHEVTLAAVIANDLTDPLEIALWEWVQKKDHTDPQEIADEHPRRSELPFDSTKKYMAVATAGKIWVKGAPEVLLEKSTLSAAARKRWLATVNSLADKGLRAIALASKSHTLNRLKTDDVDKLTFLGVVGISDPVRHDVSQALAACRQAGISVKVVTGDYRLTAEAVLAELGIPIDNPSSEIIEGKELAHLSPDELARRVKTIRLFCRVTPEQKLAIVGALQLNGEVVAMTGDGINDALAIKKADIGIVVGTASDVARETADMVLLDSSFRTIVAAVAEGRVIFANIRKVVIYLLSDAFTEVLLITASLLAGLPLPLTAIQILWINIISDGLPNLALAVDPKDGEVLSVKPHDTNRSLFPLSVKRFIATTSTVKAALGFVLFALYGLMMNDLALGQTTVFVFVCLCSLSAAFSLRALDKPVISLRLFDNRWLLGAAACGLTLLIALIYQPRLSAVFHTVPLPIGNWLAAVVATGVFIFFLEAIKQKAVTAQTAHHLRGNQLPWKSR